MPPTDPSKLAVVSRAATARVHRVMNYVRDHLDGDLSLERLARVAHFSPYHFHRVFHATTGETLTRFTQRARLERACYLMMANPERELGSIALEVGFSAQSDFSRVFKKRYGVAPSRWDRRTRLDLAGIEGYEDTVARARAEGPDPVARIVEHPSCRVAYVRVVAPFEGDALARGYGELVAHLAAHGVDHRTCGLLGYSWDNYETTPLAQVRFDLAFIVDDRVGEGEVVGVHRLPAARWVQVACDGLREVAVAWDFLYFDWLPTSGYEPADLPGMKRFRHLPDAVGWDAWAVDCCLALQPAMP